MKIGAMLNEVLRSLLRRPATRLYPHERPQAQPRLRGKLHWNPDKCTGCCLCSKDCPAQAIEIIELDKANKRFVVRYHMDRCTFCAQCVQSCRQGCLEMSNEEWELASTNKEAFTVYFGDAVDVERVLLGGIEPKSDESED